MSFTLGAEVEKMTVVLSVDADFFATLRNRDGVWDPAAVIQLRFHGGPTWTATISGADAVFEVDKAVVAPVITARISKASLYYTQGASEILWASGPVVAKE